MARRILIVLSAVALAAALLPAGAIAAPGRDDKLSKIDHIVVIYEENHSFDNLYGGWEGVNGRANANSRSSTHRRPSNSPPASGRGWWFSTAAASR